MRAIEVATNFMAPKQQMTAKEFRDFIKKNPAKVKKGKGANIKLKIVLQLKKCGHPFVTEHKFCDTRRFKFDWAIIDHKIGIEYEGLMSDKSRHTTISGFSKDTQKYNLAQSLGWRVLRYTALNYGSLEVDLKKMISEKLH